MATCSKTCLLLLLLALTPRAGDAARLAPRPSAGGDSFSGALSLLALDSEIRRAQIQTSEKSLGGVRADLGVELEEASIVKLDARLAKMRAWLEENGRLTRNLEKEAQEPTAPDFKDFIFDQKASNDACSARLLEAKRALDTLSREMVDASGNVEAQVEIQITETENLKISAATIKQIKARNKELEGNCDKAALEADKEADKYEAELEELRQISNPEVRHQEALKDANADPEDGLALVSFNHSQCVAFVAFAKKKRSEMQKKKEKKHGSSLREKIHAPEDDERECDKERTRLQASFTKAFLDITRLKAAARHRAGPERQECHDGILAQLAQELSPLLSQRDGCTKRLEEASAAIPILKSIIDSAGARVERLKEHLVNLKKECIEAGGATKHLKTIRELIFNLEHCPGQNDFQLDVPVEKEEEEGDENETEE